MSKSQRWWFDKKSIRQKLTREEVRYWNSTLRRLLKVGIELEYNLPEQKGTCRMDDLTCQCVAIFNAKKPMRNTAKCHEQCKNWDSSVKASGEAKYPDSGNCEIAKEHGCAGSLCAAFASPCSTCSKYDRGCSSCSNLFNIKKNPKNIRKRLAAKLQPTKFVGDFGKKGVYQVVPDGSLKGDGGVEVVTVGRRPEFNSLHSMLKEIMDLCEEAGAFVDERCSIHVHLLASYLNKKGGRNDHNADFLVGNLTELEKPVPEIILANYHQLIRRYQNALIWMGSSGESLNALTRWEKFRKPVAPFSAFRKKMDIISKEISKSCYKAKYAFINYEPTKYNEEGDIDTLHIEARYLDGMFSPAVVASHAILMYGLMLKAVELSKHGTLMSGSREYMERQKVIYANLCNNDAAWGPNRHSDTRNISEYIPELKEQSEELTRLVKNTLTSQAPSADVLASLGEFPVSLRRIEGWSWKDIENQLINKEEEQSMPDFLQELIDTSFISGCENQDNWVEQAAGEVARAEGKEDDVAYLEQNKTSIKGFISRCVDKGDISWAKEIGCFMRRF